MAGPFEQFLKSSGKTGGQAKAGPFTAFLESEQNKALPPGAEQTGLPGVPAPAVPMEEQGVLETAGRSAGQTVDSFMRTGASALYGAARGGGALVEAVDRKVQQIADPALPITGSQRAALSGPSIAGEAGAALKEFGDRGLRQNPPSVAMQAVNKNIIDNPEVLTDPVFWAGLGGNVIGSMMTMLPVGLGAANATARAVQLTMKSAKTAQIAAATGGAAAGAFVETFFDAGNSYQDAIEAGASPELAGQVAAQVFMREYPTTLAFNQMGLFNPTVKKGIRHALLSAVGEGAQEVGQGLAQRSAVRDVTGKEPKEGIWAETPVEFLSGLLGGPVGSVFTGPMMDEAGAQDVTGMEGTGEPAPTAKPTKPQKQPKGPKTPPAAPAAETGAAPTAGGDTPVTMPGVVSVTERGKTDKGTPIYSVSLDQVEATGPYSAPDEDAGEEPLPPSDPSKPIFARYDEDSGKLLVGEGSDLVEAARRRGDASVDVVIVNHKRAKLNITAAAAQKAAASEAPPVSTMEGGAPPVSEVPSGVGGGVPGAAPVAPVSNVPPADGNPPAAQAGAPVVDQQQPVAPTTPRKSIRDYRAQLGLEPSGLKRVNDQPRGEGALFAEVTTPGKQVFERAKAKAAAAKQANLLKVFEKLGERTAKRRETVFKGYQAVRSIWEKLPKDEQNETLEAFRRGHDRVPLSTESASEEETPSSTTPVETPTTPVAKPEVPQQPQAAASDASPLAKVVTRLRADLQGGKFPKNGLELASRYQQETGKGIVESGSTMKDAYDAMETAVNQHIAEDIGPEVLAMPVSDAIRRMNEFTQALPTQTVRTTEQVEFQQFSTPPALAMLAAKAANIQPGETVLEPSAGTGGLAAWAKAAGATVETNELAPRRRELLGMSGYSPTGHNAERIRDMRPDLQPDVVLMNPPFSATAGRLSTNKNSVGYQHVISALQTLKPGGRLVAILGRGAAPDAPNAAKFWQDIAKQGATVRANVGLSGKNYAKYGTHFDNRLLIVDKAKVEGTPITGEFEKLEDAYNAISGILSRGPMGASPGRAQGVSGEESAAGQRPVDGNRNRDGRQNSGAGVESAVPDGAPGRGSTDAGSGPATEPQRLAGTEPASSDPGGSGDSGGVVGASGISAEDLIAQVTANLQAQGYTLAPSETPAPTPQQQQQQTPKATKPRTPKPKPAPATPSPTTKTNPLESAAEAARQRLRAKMNGTALNSGIDPQDLVDIATIGAKHIVDGATAFKAWAERMRADVGDLVNWMAAASQQTADAVLRQIHQVARSVAKKFGIEAEATPAEEKAATIETGKVDRSGDQDEGDGPFATYRPSKLRTGKSHKEATGTGLVETANMASVEPPDIKYKPSLPQSLIESGKISDAQLEAIVYAGQAHSQVMGDGRRAGYMIGDGTGVGKGTEAAGIVLDNWRQGRKKTLWLSLKSGLVKQAQRDLDWVESGIQAKMANDWNFGEDIQHDGVVFASYLMLTQQSSDGSKGTRLDQILKWKPDVIIMDESHAMKNAVGTAALSEDGDKNILATEGSKSGLAGIQLDEGLPDARVVYLSATGFTDVINVGYASRLGLWGPGTAFTDFKDFMVQIERGGLGAMELVARELKAMGRYVARSISYDGVEYREVEAKLNPAQKQMYDSAVQAWQVILANIDKAIDATTNEGEGRARGLARARALSQFWSRNLSFYRQLLVTMKVPTLIQEIQTALDQNKSVFLDLVSTSEASANRGLSKAMAEGTDFADLDLSAKSIIRDFLDKAFPIYLTEEYELESGGKAVRTVKDEKGDPVVSQEALELREKLKRDLDQIKLPKSPIDEIIDYFGENQVAEISGRKARVVEDPNTGKPVEQKRVKPKGAVAKDVNDWERQQFMNGSKRIAIATAAGGTGFDFHADKRVKNQQRRVHITIEPSWSADAQMQKYGRTHRTNQSSAPEYVLVATDMGGEKRFISAIAARLSSLGALTRGERKAGGASATLEKYNIENEYGQAAVNFVLSQIANPEVPAQFVKDVSVRLRPLPAELQEFGSENVLALLGITKNDAQNGIPVTQFLNRLANTPTAIQGALFDQLMDTFDDIMKAVKEAGIYDDGTIRLKALEAKIKSEDVLRNSGGSPTKHVVVEATFPITYHQFADVRWHLQPGSVPLYASQVVPGLYRNKRSGQLWAVRESRESKFDAETGRVVTMASAIGTRKNSSRSFPADQLGDAFDKVAIVQKENWDELARMWNDEVSKLPRTETDDVHLITGAVLQVWKQLQGTGKLDIVTVSGRGGEPVTGIRLGRLMAKDTVAILKGEANFSPQTFFDKVWNNNQTVQLNGATMRKTRIMGESVISIQAADSGGVRALEGMGLQSQQTAAGQQFFISVPRDPSEADIERVVATIAKVLQRFAPKVEQQVAAASPTPASPPVPKTVVPKAKSTGIMAQLWKPTKDQLKEGVPFAVYKKGSSRLTIDKFDGNRGNAMFAVAGLDGYFTNGQMIVKGEPESYITENKIGKQLDVKTSPTVLESVKSYLNPQPPNVLRPAAFQVGDDVDYVWFSNEQAIDRRYYDYIMNRGDVVTWREGHKGSVQGIDAKGQVAAVVMPFTTKPSDTVKRLIAGAGSGSGGGVYLGSGIGALQQVYERVAQELGPVLRSKLSALHMSSPKQIGKAISREALVYVWDEFRSLEKNMERKGGESGAKLMRLLNLAEDRGEVAAGQRLVRLVDAGLSKLSEAEARNLVDILQGRPGTIALNAKVTDAALIVRDLLDEIGQEAEDIGVLVRRLVENPSTGAKESVRVQFEKRSNYFPHVIRNVDALRFGPVRNDVIDNIIRLDLLSKMKNAPSAEEFVDAYIDWVDNGGRNKKLLEYLVASGQFADADEAYAVMLRMRQSVKRSGSMEYSREINFPLWDPDPRRVLPQWIASQSIRLAQIELFGQDNEVIKRQIQKIGKAGHNAKWVRAHVDRILGHINEAEDPETKVSRFFRAVQGFRLGAAAAANIWQGPLNSLLKADLPSVYYGVRGAFSAQGRRFAIESGATIDPILHESVRELASSSRALEKYLRAVGFTASERLNRVIAANTGAEYARRLVGRAKLGDKAAVRGLAELGLEPHVVIANGLSDKDVLMAAKKFSDLTQFRARPQDMPAFASTPYGRVFWQFKQFSYKQTTLVYDSLIGEARRGEFGRAFRNVFVLAVVFGIAGEAAKDLRQLMYALFSGTWTDRPALGLRRWLENISAVGSIGFLSDFVGGKYARGSVDTLAGPTVSMVGKLADAAKPGTGTAQRKNVPANRRGSLPTKAQQVIKALPVPFPAPQLMQRFGLLDKPKE